MILWSPLDQVAIEGEDEEPDEKGLECEAMKKLIWYVENGEK